MQHIYIGDEGKGFPLVLVHGFLGSSKMEPGAKSLPHKHINYEEFLVLDGELIDPDNTIFKKGDFITFEPESSHSSYTKNGCLLLVFQKTKNEPLKK